MKNEFTNRQGMFHISLDTLNKAEHKVIWHGKEPEIFEEKVNGVSEALKQLDEFCQAHGSDITGVTQDKAREEREAVSVAVPLAGFLVEYFTDHDDLTNATKVDFKQSALRALRDQEEVGKLREVRDLGKSLVEHADPQIAAAAKKYGITALALESVDKEVEEYAAAVNAPQSSIAQRAALSKQLRDRFHVVEVKFISLDNLILAFNGTSEGRAHRRLSSRASCAIWAAGIKPLHQRLRPELHGDGEMRRHETGRCAILPVSSSLHLLFSCLNERTAWTKKTLASPLWKAKWRFCATKWSC